MSQSLIAAANCSCCTPDGSSPYWHLYAECRTEPGTYLGCRRITKEAAEANGWSIGDMIGFYLPIEGNCVEGVDEWCLKACYSLRNPCFNGTECSLQNVPDQKCQAPGEICDETDGGIIDGQINCGLYRKIASSVDCDKCCNGSSCDTGEGHDVTGCSSSDISGVPCPTKQTDYVECGEEATGCVGVYDTRETTVTSDASPLPPKCLNVALDSVVVSSGVVRPLDTFSITAVRSKIDTGFAGLTSCTWENSGNIYIRIVLESQTVKAAFNCCSPSSSCCGCGSYNPITGQEECCGVVSEDCCDFPCQSCPPDISDPRTPATLGCCFNCTVVQGFPTTDICNPTGNCTSANYVEGPGGPLNGNCCGPGETLTGYTTIVIKYNPAVTGGGFSREGNQDWYCTSHDLNWAFPNAPNGYPVGSNDPFVPFEDGDFGSFSTVPTSMSYPVPDCSDPCTATQCSNWEGTGHLTLGITPPGGGCLDNFDNNLNYYWDGEGSDLCGNGYNSSNFPSIRFNFTVSSTSEQW